MIQFPAMSAGNTLGVSGRHVLVVDDDRELLETLVDILEHEGYTVSAALGRQSGLEEAERVAPHVAVLDIRLGVDSGMDLLEDLRRLDPQLVCIMMTGYTSIDTAMEAIHKGAYDYLQKPVEMRYLFSILDRCFEKIKLRDQSEDAHRAVASQNEKLEELNQKLLAEAHRAATALSELTRSQERLRRAQRVGRIGTWEVDADTLTVWGSGEAYELFGLEPRAEPVGLDELLDHFEPLERVAIQEALHNLVIEGGSVDLEYRVKRGSRSPEMWLDIKGEMHRTVDGRTATVLGTVRNITERKQAELALKELNAQLEERVTRRTADLEAANQELRTAKDGADTAARQTQEVADDLGRKIRTPLDALVAGLDRCLGESLPAAAAARIKEARTSADILRQVVAKTLASRLPPGRG
jgi:PAS domain S-box-containing protein